MDSAYAEYLFKKTIEDYNQIARDYARSRNFIWDIESLTEYVMPGEKILDLGCGNGRLLEILKNQGIDYVGVDISERLIELAKKKYPGFGFQTANALNLPFPDNYFDKIFSIRVLAHFPSKEFRLRFLEEAKRVLKPKGLLILTVWNVWGCRNRTNLLRLIKSTFLKLIGLSRLDFGDALIPWGKGILRYYHYFTKRELKIIVEKSGFKTKKIWTASGPRGYSDIYMVAEKEILQKP